MELLEAAWRLPASDARDRLKRLTGGLHSLDPEKDVTGDDNRLAFWINVYNALVMHALDVEGRHGTITRRLSMFRRNAWRIGQRRYSLDFIEHGLLRRNARPPVSLFRVAWSRDPRLASAPSILDPRIHFALNCGAISCPPVRTWFSGSLDAQLAEATRAYFVKHAALDREAGTLTLPKLMKYYRGDFGSRGEMLAFAARHLAEPDSRFVTENGARLRIRFGPYDWRVLHLAPV